MHIHTLILIFTLPQSCPKCVNEPAFFEIFILILCMLLYTLLLMEWGLPFALYSKHVELCGFKETELFISLYTYI